MRLKMNGSGLDGPSGASPQRIAVVIHEKQPLMASLFTWEVCFPLLSKA